MSGSKKNTLNAATLAGDEALLFTAFDNLFRLKMEEPAVSGEETPQQKITGVYLEMFLALINRHGVIDRPAAAIAMSTAAGMISEINGGPPLTRICIENVQLGSMIQYREGLRSGRNSAPPAGRTSH